MRFSQHKRTFLVVALIAAAVLAPASPTLAFDESRPVLAYYYVLWDRSPLSGHRWLSHVLVRRWRSYGHYLGHLLDIDASPGTSGHIRYFTFDTLERLLHEAGLTPLGRWTNVVHFSVFGSSELVGRLRPSLGHTLITVAAKPA